jgi:hypothetical protein
VLELFEYEPKEHKRGSCAEDADKILSRFFGTSSRNLSLKAESTKPAKTATNGLLTSAASTRPERRLVSHLARARDRIDVGAIERRHIDGSGDGFALRSADTIGASDGAPRRSRLNGEVIPCGHEPALEVTVGSANTSVPPVMPASWSRKEHRAHSIRRCRSRSLIGLMNATLYPLPLNMVPSSGATSKALSASKPCGPVSVPASMSGRNSTTNPTTPFVRVPMTMMDGMDPVQRAVAAARIVDGAGGTAGLHRPGFRLPASDGRKVTERDPKGRLKATYEEEPDEEEECETSDAAMRARDAAYVAYDQDLTNSWRNDAEETWGEEGDICTLREGGRDEGSPGHLRRIGGNFDGGRKPWIAPRCCST